MLRRAITGFLSILTLSSAAIVAAPSAQAAEDCNLSVTNRVAISRQYIPIPVTVNGVCAVDSWAAWDLIHPTQGEYDGVLFDGETATTWDVYAWYTKIGKQTWRPYAAYDVNDNELTQNSPTTDVRLAAAAWISSSRSGNVVTLTGTSLIYSTGTDRFFKRSASGVFQFRERGTTTWKPLKAVTTSSTGTVTLKYTYSQARDYRFALYSTPISWDVGSAITTR